MGGEPSGAVFLLAMLVVTMATLGACAAWTYLRAVRDGRRETMAETTGPIWLSAPGLVVLFLVGWPWWLVGQAMVVVALWFVFRLMTNIDHGYLRWQSPFRRGRS